MHHIKALSQHRIRGATALVCIESLCGPGEVSQSHLRMTVEYGQTIRKMLIPIWVKSIHDNVLIKTNVTENNLRPSHLWHCVTA